MLLLAVILVASVVLFVRGDRRDRIELVVCLGLGAVLGVVIGVELTGQSSLVADYAESYGLAGLLTGFVVAVVRNRRRKVINL